MALVLALFSSNAIVQLAFAPVFEVVDLLLILCLRPFIGAWDRVVALFFLVISIGTFVAPLVFFARAVRAREFVQVGRAPLSGGWFGAPR